VQKIGEHDVIMRNYEGKKFRYVQPYAAKNEMKKFKETCRKIFEGKLGENNEKTDTENVPADIKRSESVMSQ